MTWEGTCGQVAGLQSNEKGHVRINKAVIWGAIKYWTQVKIHFISHTLFIHISGNILASTPDILLLSH